MPGTWSRRLRGIPIGVHESVEQTLLSRLSSAVVEADILEYISVLGRLFSLLLHGLWRSRQLERSVGLLSDAPRSVRRPQAIERLARIGIFRMDDGGSRGDVLHVDKLDSDLDETRARDHVPELHRFQACRGRGARPTNDRRYESNDSLLMEKPSLLSLSALRWDDVVVDVGVRFHIDFRSGGEGYDGRVSLLSIAAWQCREGTRHREGTYRKVDTTVIDDWSNCQRLRGGSHIYASTYCRV